MVDTPRSNVRHLVQRSQSSRATLARIMLCVACSAVALSTVLQSARADDIMNWSPWTNSLPQARVGATSVITDHFLFIVGGLQRPISGTLCDFWQPSGDLVSTEHFHKHYVAALQLDAEEKLLSNATNSDSASLRASLRAKRDPLLRDHYPLPAEAVAGSAAGAGVSIQTSEEVVSDDGLLPTILYFDLLIAYKFFPLTTSGDVLLPIVTKSGVVYHPGKQLIFFYACDINRDRLASNLVSIVTVTGDMEELGGEGGAPVSIGSNAVGKTTQGPSNSIPRKGATMCRYSNFYSAATDTFIHHSVLNFVKFENVSMFLIGGVDINGNPISKVEQFFNYTWSMLPNGTVIGDDESRTQAVREAIRQKHLNRANITSSSSSETGPYFSIPAIDLLASSEIAVGVFDRPYCYCSCIQDPHQELLYISDCVDCASGEYANEVIFYYPEQNAFQYYLPPIPTTTTTTAATVTTSATTPTTTAVALSSNFNNNSFPQFNTEFYWLATTHGVGSRLRIGQYYMSISYNGSINVQGSSLTMGIYDTYTLRQDLKPTIQISIDRYDCAVFSVSGSVMCLGGTFQTFGAATSSITARGDFCETVPSLVTITDKAQYIVSSSHGFKHSEKNSEAALTSVDNIPDATMSIFTHNTCLGTSVLIITSDSECRNPVPFLSTYACAQTITVSLTSLFLLPGEYLNMYMCYTDGTCAVSPAKRLVCITPDPGGDSCRWQRCCWDPALQMCFQPGAIDDTDPAVIASTPWRIATTEGQGKAPIMPMVTIYNPIQQSSDVSPIWYKVPWVIACLALSFLIIVYFTASLYWRLKKRRIEMQKSAKYVNSAFFEAFGKKYTVEGLIGEGGYGAVFLAERTRDHQHVALKIVPCQDSKQRDAALSEFDVLNKLKHPNVIEVLDLIISWDQSDSTPHIQTGMLSEVGYGPNMGLRKRGSSGSRNGSPIGTGPRMYGSPSSRVMDKRQSSPKTPLKGNSYISFRQESQQTFYGTEGADAQKSSVLKDSVHHHAGGGSINNAGSDLRTPLVGGGSLHKSDSLAKNPSSNGGGSGGMSYLETPNTGNFGNVLNYQALHGTSSSQNASSPTSSTSQLPSRFICLVSDYYPEGDLTRFILHYPRRGAVRVKREEDMGDPLKHVLGLEGRAASDDGEDSVGVLATTQMSASCASATNDDTYDAYHQEPDRRVGVEGVSPREFSRTSSLASSQGAANGGEHRRLLGPSSSSPTQALRESRGAVVDFDVAMSMGEDTAVQIPGLSSRGDQFTFFAAAEAAVQGQAKGGLGAKNLPVPEVIVVSIALQIASALHFMHSQSRPIVHRDLKPDNVLVDGDRVLLTDFGLSSWAKSPLNDNKGACVGTLFFAAPETFGIDCGILDDQEDGTDQDTGGSSVDPPRKLVGSVDSVSAGASSSSAHSPPKRLANNNSSMSSDQGAVTQIVSFRPVRQGSIESSTDPSSSRGMSGRYTRNDTPTNGGGASQCVGGNRIDTTTNTAATEILLDYNGHQLELAASPPVDMWGLGCVLYAICTKRVTDSTARVMFSDIDEEDFERTMREELSAVNVACTVDAPSTSTQSSPVSTNHPQFNTAQPPPQRKPQPPTTQQHTRRIGYSDALQDIILNLLQKNPLKRLTAEEASAALAALYHRHEHQVKKRVAAASAARADRVRGTNKGAARRGESRNAAAAAINQPFPRHAVVGIDTAKSVEDIQKLDKVQKRRTKR